MRATLTRWSPLLLVLCLTGCGQTGPLFMRMPYNAIKANWLPPPLSTTMTPIVGLPPESTAVAPASATAPAPTAASHSMPVPAAGTRAAPAASTH